MSKHGLRATQIVKQLYAPRKAEVIAELIRKAKNDYAIDRILHDARNGKVRA